MADFTLKCDPKGYFRIRKIIALGDLEGFDGSVAAVKALTGHSLAYCSVRVDASLPADPIYPDGYGHLEPKP